MKNGGELLNQLVTLILLNGVQVSKIVFQYVDSVVECAYLIHPTSPQPHTKCRTVQQNVCEVLCAD
jgi:hypothetical protein